MPEESQENTAPEMPLGVFEQEVLDLARRVAVGSADYPEQVGELVSAYEVADHVVDFRLEAHMKGYEGWQWSVTLYQDVERGIWTVNESSLIPGQGSLLPPQWIPWKDRLLPSDLSVTDVLGTERDDERLERGFRKTRSLDDITFEIDRLQHIQKLRSIQSEITSDSEHQLPNDSIEDRGYIEDHGQEESSSEKLLQDESTKDAAALSDHEIEQRLIALEKERDELVEQREIIQSMELSRRRVLTPLGRSQAAERWYNGQPGPKSLSTKVAHGSVCQTCGFFIPLTGELNVMFGVCANAWSPDDGRVVSRDHGCGQHSQIEPPSPASLWVQPKPAFDDMHIDIVAQAPRIERESIDAIEQAEHEAKKSVGQVDTVEQHNVENHEDSADNTESTAAQENIGKADNTEIAEDTEKNIEKADNTEKVENIEKADKGEEGVE